MGIGRRKAKTVRFIVILICSVFLGTFVSLAALTDESRTITARELESRIAKYRLQVEEFKAISHVAKERGLRLYLLGGSATALADYLLGLHGTQPDQADFYLEAIYRSDQDLDIVVGRADDGFETVEDIKSIQKIIDENFPNQLSNGRSKWEVRGLRTTMGEKVAVLSDDFLNQNNDTLSLGLIELTEPPEGSGSCRYIPSWHGGGGENRFLNDLAGGDIHFLRSKSHGQTSRAGVNPEILAVIRALTKAFQYNKKIDSSSLEVMQAIIRGFDPHGELPPYVQTWIEHKGKHLVTRSANVERTWDILEDLGLRQKLIQIRNDGDQEGSLAWWLGREPLRTQHHPKARPIEWVGKNITGRTAGELGIKYVGHSTTLAGYESIASNRDSHANVFISRKEMNGEGAARGEGFYATEGTTSHLGKGPEQVTYEVDPSAKEGEDFMIFPGDAGPRILVFSNGAKLKQNPLDRRMMFQNMEHLIETDLRLAMTLLRTRRAKSQPEWRRWVEVASKGTHQFKPSQLQWILETLPVTDIFAESIMDAAVRTEEIYRQFPMNRLAEADWRNHPKAGEWLDTLIDGLKPFYGHMNGPIPAWDAGWGVFDTFDYKLVTIFEQPGASKFRPQLKAYIEKAIAHRSTSALIKFAERVFSKSPWVQDTELLQKIVEGGLRGKGNPARVERLRTVLISEVFSKAEASTPTHQKLLRRLQWQKNGFTRACAFLLGF